MPGTFNKKHLLLLFERPQEPCFLPKGPNKSVFILPPEFLVDTHVSYTPEIIKKYQDEAGELIHVKAIPPPDIDDILKLGRHTSFSRFIPKHRKIAGRIVELFLSAKNLQELLSLAVYTRDRINPYLFNFSYSISLLHRPDTDDLDVPAVIHFFPDKFFSGQVFTRAREIANIIPPELRTPIEVPINYTSSNLDQESLLAYFREDIGANLHHWHWHLVYPFEAPLSVVTKDRRGELFYYSHQQIVARYNFERLSNKIPIVEKFTNWNATISQGYYPKLVSIVSGRPWPGRAPNTVLKSLKIDSEEIKVDLVQVGVWRDRIMEAIKAGFVFDEKNRKIRLTEEKGMDIVGNVLESSTISVNRPYYGDMHNMGHVLSAYAHDPDNKYLESYGVMADSATAMRDPFFYPWHAYVNGIFETFKEGLPRYTAKQLSFANVSLLNVQVQSDGGQTNRFETFWQQSDVDISKALDFQPQGPIYIRFTHLQHKAFKYTITVNNDSTEIKEGTCRIFLAPKYDEKGKGWTFEDQKNLFVEMDKFKVILKPGINTINQSSLNSSVTISAEQTFRDINWTRPLENEKYNFCGCGWPQYMLIPRGFEDGMECQLFVMISNYADDKINQTIEEYSCSDAYSYCGIKNKLYPDRRAMGYPFDRPAREGVENIWKFLTPNMFVQDVSIKYEDSVLKPAGK